MGYTGVRESNQPDQRKIKKKTITQESNGRTIEYRVHEYLNQILVDVVVDGKRHTTGTPEPTDMMVQGRHVYGRIVNVQIGTENIWNQVWTAYSESKTDLESSFDYQL